MNLSPLRRHLRSLTTVLAIIFLYLCCLFGGQVPGAHAYNTYGNARWPDYGLPVLVDLEGINTNLGSLTADQVKSEIRSAMATWNSAGTIFKFAEGRGANLLEQIKIVAGTPVDYPPLEGNVAITGFMTADGQCGPTAPGNIHGACIILNSTGVFKNDCQMSGSSHDLQTTVLHELGHALGLDHTQDYNVGAVMWKYTNLANYWPGCRRQLAQDDIDGLISLYGPVTPVPAPTTPTLVSPIGGAKIAPSKVNLIWIGTQNTSSYFVQVAASSDFRNLVYSATVPINSIAIPALPPGASYSWRVKASGTGGMSLWSATGNFSTLIRVFLPAVSKPSGGPVPCKGYPTLIYPANQSQLDTISPRFQYNPGYDVTHTALRLEVAAVPDFGQLVFSMTDDYGTSPVSPYDVDYRNFSNLQPSTTYYWRMFFRCGSVPGPYSPVNSFTTAPPRTLIDAPTLLSPANGEIVSPTKPTLSWSSVPNTIEYALRMEKVGIAGGVSWWVKGATSDRDEILKPNTTYVWWVQASDYYALGPDSQHWQFTTTAATVMGSANAMPAVDPETLNRGIRQVN